MQQALRMAKGGSMVGSLNPFELFVSAQRISPFVPIDVTDRVCSPVVFITPTGEAAYGYDAIVMAELCETVLSARG